MPTHVFDSYTNLMTYIIVIYIVQTQKPSPSNVKWRPPTKKRNAQVRFEAFLLSWSMFMRKTTHELQQLFQCWRINKLKRKKNAKRKKDLPVWKHLDEVPWWQLTTVELCDNSGYDEPYLINKFIMSFIWLLKSSKIYTLKTFSQIMHFTCLLTIFLYFLGN